MPQIHPGVDDGLGNSAYVVELGGGRALVIDPARDPTPYLELARWRRLQVPELTEPLARAAYQSLHWRPLPLPDELAVYPIHGAGSFCAASAGGERTTTIGAERRHHRLAGDRVPAKLLEGPVAVMCSHGQRAMTAASLLERAGRQDLRVVVGGPEDWQQATGQALARS